MSAYPIPTRQVLTNTSSKSCSLSHVPFCNKYQDGSLEHSQGGFLSLGPHQKLTENT